MTIAASPLERETTEPEPTPRDRLDAHVSGRDAVGDDPRASGAAEGGIDIAERVRAFADGEYRQVVATVALWSGSTDDAADAVADALGRAWERLDEGRPIDNLAAFVTTVAMNRVRSTHRRTALFRRKRHLLAVVDTAESANAVARRVDLARTVRALPRRQQEVIALRYGADLSIDAIADRLGVAPGTVKATLHQARSALADRLAAAAEGATDD